MHFIDRIEFFSIHKNDFIVKVMQAILEEPLKNKLKNIQIWIDCDI